jgi:hypothetical protein
MKIQGIKYFVGKRMVWIPLYWKWDEKRDVVVEKCYPRGKAKLSNGVIVDDNGMALIYGAGREVGKAVEIVEMVNIHEW